MRRNRQKPNPPGLRSEEVRDIILSDSGKGEEVMETGAIVAVSVVLVVAVLAVLICIFSAVSTVSGIKHTNDEDTDA